MRKFIFAIILICSLTACFASHENTEVSPIVADEETVLYYRAKYAAMAVGEETGVDWETLQDLAIEIGLGYLEYRRVMPTSDEIRSELLRH
ncbi:MAG: hypothetical protein JEY79_14060 [Pseudodesulfovibrio sp.]|nr:hypothetical protein [Pseudodesulfovibrio sp.]